LIVAATCTRPEKRKEKKRNGVERFLPRGPGWHDKHQHMYLIFGARACVSLNSFTSFQNRQNMPSSLVLKAKRALVKMLLSLARIYLPGLHITRDSDDKEVQEAYQRVVLKVHPDKGGSIEHTQQLQNAKEACEKVLFSPCCCVAKIAQHRYDSFRNTLLSLLPRRRGGLGSPSPPRLLAQNIFTRPCWQRCPYGVAGCHSAP
jgi:hypothetical protein